ncbi:MAG: hypothetical protein AAFR44_13335, partial [Pseudomonadota bacterium]
TPATPRCQLSVTPGSRSFSLATLHVERETPVVRQPCGGTHVARTGEIGALSLGKIEKKGRQNRRVSVILD